MKILFIYLFIICLLSSCVITTISVIDYKYKRKKKSPTFYMSVPKGYEVSYLFGDHEYTQQYLYNDSSMIYITTFDNTPNYKEIRKQHYYYKRFVALLNHDTLCIKGVDSLGRYWKDSLMSNGITLGYTRVPKEKKLEYDKYISSFRSKP